MSKGTRLAPQWKMETVQKLRSQQESKKPKRPLCLSENIQLNRRN